MKLLSSKAQHARNRLGVLQQVRFDPNRTGATEMYWLSRRVDGLVAQRTPSLINAAL
jgi:hypothetical protein